MTDQPDRPDGDGLLPALKQCPKCWRWSNDPQHEQTCQFATRDALEPECGWANRVAVLEAALDDEASIVRSLREELTKYRDGAEGADQVVLLADDDEISRKVIDQPWNVQSAIVTIAAHCTVLKDAHSSGMVSNLAGCISQSCLELANALSAPPKPAPDALRASFEVWATADHRGIQPLECEERTDANDHYYEADTDNAAFIGWKAAISAPVPSPDGALATGILNSLEETAKYLRRADPATIDMDGVTQILLTGIKQLRPFLSPSPAVAAEPDSDTDKAFIDAIYKCDMETRKAIVAFLSGAASLPVRGDREAISQEVRELLDDGEWPEYRTEDDRGLEHSEYVDFVMQVLARLHVQPGAGEREMIERHAQIADRYDGWQAENIAAQIRSEGLALSCQAPHSSSETES